MTSTDGYAVGKQRFHLNGSSPQSPLSEENTPPAAPHPANSLEQSIALLADLALRYLEASSYAIYAFDPATDAAFTQYSGATPPGSPAFLVSAREVLALEGARVLTYPLRVEGCVIGTLAFVLQAGPFSDEKLPAVDGLAAAIERLYCLPLKTQRLFSKLYEIETSVAAGKISTRLGSLSQTPLAAESLDTARRVVENSLAMLRIPTALKHYHGEAERALRKREVSEKAKHFLQTTKGMKEEETYLYLRRTSRKRGKRIEEVARELVSAPLAPPPPNLTSHPRADPPPRAVPRPVLSLSPAPGTFRLTNLKNRAYTRDNYYTISIN